VALISRGQNLHEDIWVSTFLRGKSHIWLVRDSCLTTTAMMGEVFFRETLASFCPYNFHFSLSRRHRSIGSGRERTLLTFHNSHYHLPTYTALFLFTDCHNRKTSGSFTGNLNLSGNQWNISQAVIITAQSSVLDHTRWLHQHFVYHPINITAKASQSKISTQQLSGGSVPLAPNRSLVPPAAWDPRPNRCVVKRWCVA
jgi:hypothetical protein